MLLLMNTNKTRTCIQSTVTHQCGNYQPLTNVNKTARILAATTWEDNSNDLKFATAITKFSCCTSEALSSSCQVESLMIMIRAVSIQFEALGLGSANTFVEENRKSFDASCCLERDLGEGGHTSFHLEGTLSDLHILLLGYQAEIDMSFLLSGLTRTTSSGETDDAEKPKLSTISFHLEKKDQKQ
ncbi:hypothetical protein OPV22_018817 [Ensete ventricosum]|uniref:Uncharacterized protein n=1 Tax=Ensete ventricosum TaxID=4639 RepID=A0AAV8QV26_ENSVE|nr:hypothetical protein OPV22_018817 [Ensete ventricosum]